MDGLRWLLLLFGLFVVTGVYLYSRRERTRAQKTAAPKPDDERLEPSLGEQLPAGNEAIQESPVSDSTDPPEPPQQKIVTLRVVAKNMGTFKGDKLALSLRGVGMRHGKFGIFHRYHDDDENEVVFSAASLVEPGSFDLTNLKDQEMPGVSMFMVVPGPMDGAEAFDLMMTAARELTNMLDGELRDESGSTLSIQRERYLREEIIQVQHGIMLA